MSPPDPPCAGRAATAVPQPRAGAALHPPPPGVGLGWAARAAPVPALPHCSLQQGLLPAPGDGTQLPPQAGTRLPCLPDGFSGHLKPPRQYLLCCGCVLRIIFYDDIIV